MNAEQRHIYQRTAELKVAEGVHYPGCELVHGWCAVQALLTAHELSDIETLIYTSFYEGVEKVMWQDGPDAILLDRVQALVQTIVQHRNAQNTDHLESERSEIRASATSDTLPEYKCNVHQDFADALAMNHFALSYCPRCGDKL